MATSAVSSLNRLEAPSIPDQASLSSSAFHYPPLYAFPPFFTLQPNSTTLALQLSQWTSYLINWCRFHRVFYLHVNPSSATEEDRKLWSNETIQRSLPPEGRRRVLEHLIQQGRAIWDPPPSPPKSKGGQAVIPDQALIYWKTPIQWSEEILSWVQATGQEKSILTFSDLLAEDQDYKDQDFQYLPLPLLRRALDVLVKKGKAQVFEGSREEDGSVSGEGVKFV